MQTVINLSEEELASLTARNRLRVAERQLKRQAAKSNKNRGKLTLEEKRVQSIANVLKYW